jgi:hypothetical protein
MTACSGNKNEVLPTVIIKGEPVHILKFKEVTDTMTLHLTDIFRNVSFVKLETRDDNKLTRGKWSIGSKYVIGWIRGLGFYQFRADGKFIRKLATYGKGPLEVYYPIWTISRDEKYIYIYDSLKPKSFLCFNLNSGLHEKDIPIALEGLLRNIELINDSIIICAPIVGTGKPAGDYYLFWQSLHGKLINIVPAKSSVSKIIVPNENLVYRIDDQFHYRPTFNDTIYNVTNFELKPYIIMDASQPKNTPDHEVGSINIKIFLEASNFIIIQTDETTAKEIIGENTMGFPGIKKYYYVDKVRMKAYKISNFINDLFGFEEDPISFEDQSSIIKYIYIEPLSLLKRINRLKLNPNLKVTDRDRILSLENGTTENDNPILITLNNK